MCTSAGLGSSSAAELLCNCKKHLIFRSQFSYLKDGDKIFLPYFLYDTFVSCEQKSTTRTLKSIK